MIRAIIIDDEQNARENLLRKIKEIDDNIEVIGDAENVDKAYDLILRLKPNVIFLDIEMPGKDGFALLEMFDNIDFQIVFVTAYNDYALKAFRNFAFNYILKPIDSELLETVIHNLNKLLTSVSDGQGLKSLIQYFNVSNTHSKLGIPTESGIDMIDINNIISLEATEGYTIFKLKDDVKLTSSKRFQYFEDKLLLNSFVKIHRSFIININYLESYHKVGFVKLYNGDELPVSKAMRNQVSQTLKHGKLGNKFI